MQFATLLFFIQNISVNSVAILVIYRVHGVQPTLQSENIDPIKSSSWFHTWIKLASRVV